VKIDNGVKEIINDLMRNY